MPARAKFTREQLQQAALKIVDERGLGALSMRALAGMLDTGPMTFYNYFADREELDALVVEAVMARATLPKVRHEDWRRDARALLRALWRTVRAHPNTIPLILTRRSSHQATLETTEILLRALARSGRSGAALLAACRTLLCFLMGLAQAQLAGSLTGETATMDPHVARAHLLQPDQFPKLREIAEAAALTDSDRELESGLDIIFSGLDAQPAKRAPKPKRKSKPKNR
ncbi:MAG: TetR/AcrR family transcriptional regulator [Candidatus Binataceae bacterium]